MFAVLCVYSVSLGETVLFKSCTINELFSWCIQSRCKNTFFLDILMIELCWGRVSDLTTIGAQLYLRSQLKMTGP